MDPLVAPFLKIAAAAFPMAERTQAIAAGSALLPVIDTSYPVKRWS
jgi:hypothetical protein